MTKTFATTIGANSPNPSLSRARRVYHKSLRLALHQLSRSLISTRDSLNTSSPNLALLIQKSKSLDFEFKKLKLASLEKDSLTKKGSLEVMENVLSRKQKISLPNIRKIKARNFNKKRDGGKIGKKKTKGPSLKKLSILEFKHNKQLTNFFRAKQQEVRQLLSQPLQTKQLAMSLASNSTGFTQNSFKDSQIPQIPPLINQPNLATQHFKDLSTQSKQTNNLIPSESMLSRHLNQIFSLKRQETSTPRRRNCSNRDSKGLHQMSRALIRLLSNNPNENYPLDAICSKIQVEKRKIYDLINILTSIQMIERVSKGVYKWLGTASILGFLNSLPEFVNLSNDLKAEKSLSSMCYCFLSFMKSRQESSIENAAESLTKSLPNTKPVNSITFRSKIRRLYDISKILATVGLIENLSENKKPIMKWVGSDNMLKVVTEISNSNEDIPVGTLDMRQMMERLQTSLNNAVLTIPEAEMRRKRIESIDMGIVEKYLNNEEQGLILPRVSVLIPDA
jgi:hypothetical protein